MRYKRIGDYFKYEFLEKFGINQNEMALAIGVHQNRISEIVNHRRRITPNTDLRLCKFFKLKDGHFLSVQQEMELREERDVIFEELEKIFAYDEFRERLKI